MTQSIISLLSIFAGIIGANMFGLLFKKHSFKVIGNTMIGVFGSILFIKSLGRIGFDPNTIMETGEADYLLLALNIAISLASGASTVFIASIVEKGMNKGNR